MVTAYDAQSRRKSRTAGSATTLFATDADSREVLEYDGSGVVQRWYAYGLGPEAVLGQMNVALGTRTTLIPDIQGSIIGMLDSGSGALSRIGYQPFGENPTLTSGTYRYTAQRFDPETAGSTAQPSGLYYYRARHYSPTWGRFLQPDPIGYAAGSNLYAYVNNDPLNNTDPSGQASIAEYLARGIRIVNAAISGSAHPITGIPFKNGFPDFSSVATHTVQLGTITGNRAIDEAAANAAAGLRGTPSGYTWHHAETGIAGQNSLTMQLVPTGIHSATGHTGTAAYAKAVGRLIADVATDPTTYMSAGIGTFLGVMKPSPTNAGEAEFLAGQQSNPFTGYFGPTNPRTDPGK